MKYTENLEHVISKMQKLDKGLIAGNIHSIIHLAKIDGYFSGFGGNSKTMVSHMKHDLKAGLVALNNEIRDSVGKEPGE